MIKDLPRVHEALKELYDILREDCSDDVVAVTILVSATGTVYKEVKQPDCNYRAVSNIKGEPLSYN